MNPNYNSINNQIIEIDKTLKILPALKPINLLEEKEKFFSNQFDYNPQFIYKKLNFDPQTLINQLESIRLPQDELTEYYQDKINELKTTANLLATIGMDEFTKFSKLLYGAPSEENFKIAKSILLKDTDYPDNQTILELDEIIQFINKAIQSLNLQTQIVIQKSAKSSSNNLKVSRHSNKIFIHESCKKTPDDLKGSIYHEVYTHLLRSQNADKYNIPLLKFAPANYIMTEEGLATLVGYIHRENQLLLKPAVYIASIYNSLHGSFVETFKFINNYLKNADEAWYYTLRSKRGLEDTSRTGAFTKDQYLTWAIEVGREIISDPEVIKFIFNGKASIELLKNMTKPDDSFSKFIDTDRIINLFNLNGISYDN